VIDREARLAQSARDEFRDRGVVFDQQGAHDA
jgi:DNA phosphorothioation-dependent restriction protein DptG